MNKYSIEDIQRELNARMIMEARQKIASHREAISRLSEQVEAIEQAAIPPTPPPTVAPTQQQDVPERMFTTPKPDSQVRLGPCARTILDLIQATKTPLSEAQIQRCTQYSTVMLRKATAGLLEAGLIFKVGDARKAVFSSIPQPVGGKNGKV